MTETNESAFPEQNESKNMETNDEEEMSLQDKPIPKPRARGPKDDEMFHVQKLHEKREAKWLNEKENLLAKIDYLEKQKDEHKQTLKSNCETLEKKCEDLKKTCEDWEMKCEQLLAQEQEALEIIKALQEKSEVLSTQNQTYVHHGQAFQNEVFNLQKHLDEKDELYKQALERNEVYEDQLVDDEREIQGLKEELAKHEKKLTKQKDQYAEFSSITNDMERELHENQSKVRELNRILRAKTEENRQMLEEKDEAIRKFERMNETLSSQVAMLGNNTRKTQSDKDKLESELVTMKLEFKKLVTENEKIQEKTQKLADERDFYVEKCRKLEEGVKINAETEISHLTEAVEGLNHENEVLRERNEKLQRDVSALRSINNDLQAKNTQSNGSLGEDNNAFKSEETLRQKIPELMDTSNGINTSEVRRSKRSSDRSGPRGAPTPASTPTAKSTNRSTGTPSGGKTGPQWYETGEGGEIFSQIYSELNQRFATIDISREVSTKDISLLVTTDQRQKFEVHFPRNFPLDAVKVSYADTLKEVMVPFNKNAGSSDFCTNFSRMLAELMYEVNKQK